MRICFDLDDTLCTGSQPDEHGVTDYSKCSPVQDAARMLRGLKGQGHTIIIHTARGMTTGNGNVGKVVRNVGLLTLSQLEAWGFEYDEIYFGKPSADLYVDDKGINAQRYWDQHWEERQWQ